jgi:type 1 glutamine amidotransferase
LGWFLLADHAYAEAQQRVLVYTRNGEGYVHKNIDASVKALKKMGRQHDFGVVVSDDPFDFNRDYLSRYDAVIFCNTNTRVFSSDEQRLALVHYVEAGGGLVGIHSAVATERNWPWFSYTMGGRFVRHPAYQKFDIRVLDEAHPSVSFLGDVWPWEDECYFVDRFNPANRVLLAADLTTVKDEKRKDYPGQIFGDFFPLAWCRETAHGRVFNTTLGHAPEDYSNPRYLKHLWGGLRWVLEDGGKLDYSRATTRSVHVEEPE